MKKQKVVIVDDHRIFRKGLKFVIDDCKFAKVIAEVASGEEFLNNTELINADIVFMDINMPNMNGFEVTRKALIKNKELKIIGMSANDDVFSIQEMLSLGAKGYLEKDAEYDEIHQAIKNIAEQKNYFSNNIFIKLTRNITRQTHKKKHTNFENLTKREQSVLELVCKGLSNTKISEKLNIATRTVEKHKANLYIKTGTENALNLALYAFKNNIVEFNY